MSQKQTNKQIFAGTKQLYLGISHVPKQNEIKQKTKYTTQHNKTASITN